MSQPHNEAAAANAMCNPHLISAPLPFSIYTRSRILILQAASDDAAASSSSSSSSDKSENDAIWGLTDLGNANFGKFGSEIDPHRNMKPMWMDAQAEWKKDEGCDFLPELKEIQSRIQVCYVCM